MSTPVATSTVHPLIGKHQQTLDRALQAIRDRGYWSAYAESPSPRQYGEAAAEAGRSAFEGRLGQPLQLGQPGVTGLTGEELSPYGLPLGITYPHVTDIGALLGAMRAAMPAWRDAGPETRAAVCVEILDRINARSFEIAHAVMHTTGQAFVMAFQAGGPHAQDRGLEAVAYAYDEMTRVPGTALLGEAAGQARSAAHGEDVPRRAARRRAGDRLQHVPDLERLPRPVRLPGHRQPGGGQAAPARGAAAGDHRAGLPARCWPRPASTRTWCALAAEAPGGRAGARRWRCAPEVRIIDFTGSTAFGDWLESQRPPGAGLHREGRRQHGGDRLDRRLSRACCSNLAFSLSLYSGQMCTTPQNLLMPRDGIETDGGAQVVRRGGAGHRRRGRQAARRRRAGGRAARRDRQPGRARRGSTGHPALGKVVLASRAVTHPEFPDASVRTPVIVGRRRRPTRASTRRSASARSRSSIATDSTRHSLSAAAGAPSREHGAMTVVGLLDLDASVHRRRRARLPRRRGRAVGEPHRRRVRQPDRGVLRLPRHRRQPGRQRGADRRRLRRLPLPGRPVRAGPYPGRLSRRSRGPPCSLAGWLWQVSTYPRLMSSCSSA